MGEEELFEKMVLETQLQLRAFIRGCGVPLDDVDDVCQEVYLTFFRNREKLPDGVQPVRWLKGVARNLCMRYFRNTKRREDRTRAAIAEILARTECPWEEAQTGGSVLQALNSCITKMSEKARKMMMLRYKDNRSCREIGTAVRLKDESVRKAMHRTRAFLRKCIEHFLREEDHEVAYQ
jgi:RNA polymerase sigma-70 factor (ECF subfamily)